MNEITIELNDEVLDKLNEICESEGCTWDEFVTIMVKSFDTLCPFHLYTLESYID